MTAFFAVVLEIKSVALAQIAAVETESNSPTRTRRAVPPESSMRISA
jgi:hypothetical protein